MRAVLIGILVLSSAARIIAQPADLTRVLRHFDFEERARGNAEDVPMDWVKIEGPGMPHYVNGTLASDQACTGRYAFRLDLNGGSLVYRYPSGSIKIYPQASYRVSAMVKTKSIQQARARISAFCTDIDGHPIKSSITHSPPFISPSDGAGNGWTPLSIELTAPDGAAWLVIEVGLLQAPLWKQPPPGQALLAEQDIEGHAWFDDVKVAQVPKVRVSCAAVGNIFHRHDPVTLQVSVNDRITDDLLGRLTLSDADGRSIFQRTGALEYTQSDPTDRSGTKVATLVLPELPAGWYRATLELTSHDISVGTESIDVIQLADDVGRVEPDKRFGVVATDLPFSTWPQLPAFLSNLGASRIKLAVWQRDGDVEESGVRLESLLEQLHDLRIATTACLAAPPPKMAAATGGATWERLPDAAPETWQGPISYFIARYAGYIDRWQFGLDEDAGRFAASAPLRAAYGLVQNQFSQLVQTPDFAMPWPAWFDLQQSAPAAVALNVSPDVLPQQLPLYIQDARRTDQFSIVLEPLPANRYGRVTRLRDFAQRIGYALSAKATRIDLPLPFTVESRDGQIINQPQEMLLVMRTMLMTLGNATFKGSVPLDPDVEAFLFDRDGEGVMLVWSKADQGASKTVPVVLGKQPRTIDLWGNVSPVLRPKDDAGTNDLEIGPIPQFLVGIDAQLALLRSSFAFDNPLLESSFAAHTRRLQFKNPYTTNISGRIRLTGPAGWSVTPLLPNFNLAPGETYSGPVSIEFPYSSFAGLKSMVCTVQLQADTEQTFKVPIPLRIGLSDVGLETTAMRDGTDIIVQQMITNYGAKPLNYTAFAVYPNLARQERLIVGLKPGVTTIKKYRFSGADVSQPTKLRAGIRETDGIRVLNDEVEIGR